MVDDEQGPDDRERAPGRLVGRVLLVVGLLLMLYVVIVISRALS